MARTHEIDMTSGSIIKKVLLFALPLMFSGILQLLFNAADTIVVGKFAGSLCLAAVGSNTPIINLIINVVIGFATGANVLVARYYGSGDHRALSDCVHSSMALGCVLGILSGLAGFFLSTPLLIWMKADPEVLPLASLYLKIYFLGAPATVIYNFGAAILRAIGDTDRPLRYLTLSGIVNVILNLVTVIVFHMDVAGVAIATVVSQYVSAFLVVYCLMRSEGCYKLELSKLRFHRDMIRQVTVIGLPAGLQGTIFSISNVLIQSSVNSFGAAAMAGCSAASNLDGFVYIAMNAFYHASLSFTSQNYGAKKYERIPKVLGCCMLLVFLVGAIMAALIVGFGPQLLSLFVPATDPNRDAVLAAGMVRLVYVCVPYFLCGFMEVLCGSLRGLGKSWTPLIISTMGSCVFRTIWLYTVFIAFRSLETVYLSYAFSWVITPASHAVALIITYRKLCPGQKRKNCAIA